jgi:hypothetical protein
MAQRVAGTAFLMVDGGQQRVRGNFLVSPNAFERNMLAGQDGVHGYQELPRVPWIECDLTTVQELNIEDLEAQVNVTVVAQLANNKQYSLGNATCKGGIEINTRDGQCRVRWEGEFAEEIQL